MKPAALLLTLALAGCAGAEGQPDLRSPAAIRRLDALKDLSAGGDPQAIAATDLAACNSPTDAVCAQGHALRAAACRLLGRLDCAIQAGQAALAAAAASPAAHRDAWREALAWSLFARRQVQPRALICGDNAALRGEADALRGATPGARFLAASARLTDSVEACARPAERCAGLASAKTLLRPAPAGDAAWAALAIATNLESGRLACPSR